MDIIAAAYLLPMDKGAPVIEGGAIACDRGMIIDAGTRGEVTKRYPTASLKTFDKDILMPGFIDAHCHLDMIDFHEQQIAEFDFSEPPFEFIDIVIQAIDYKQELKAEQVLAGMQKGVQRLVETGVTCVGDVTHFEASFHLLDEMGIRGIVYPEILAGRGETAQAKYEVALALAEKHSDPSHDGIRAGLAPFTPYLLSRNLLKIISQHAKEGPIPLQIHAAESFAEMEFFFDSQGPIASQLFPALGWKELPPAQRKTPVQYLADIGFFDAPVTIVGGLHLSKSDFPILARNLVRIVYCPTLNKVMKHGSLPLGKLVESGIPVGLGTGIWNTRLGFNLWDEMRLALTRGSDPLPKPRELLKMATVGGARALGLDHLVGSLTKGKKADYLLVRAPKFATEEECYGELIASTEPQHIRRVVVGESILKSTH